MLSTKLKSFILTGLTVYSIIVTVVYIVVYL